MTSITTYPSTLTAEPLWARARAMFARALAATGGPIAIAAITIMSRALRRSVIRWLCPLENIVRKLLLAEAAELHRHELEAAARGPRIVSIPIHSLGLAMHVSPTSAKSAVQRARSQRAIDLSQPEAWRAPFAFSIPRDPRLVPETRAPRIRALWGPDPSPPPPPPARAPRRVLDPALLLARRFEALRRVLSDPMPYARRLMQLLAHVRRRFSEVVARYAFKPCRSDDYDPADRRLSIDAIGSAMNAPLAFADTS